MEKNELKVAIIPKASHFYCIQFNNLVYTFPSIIEEDKKTRKNKDAAKKLENRRQAQNACEFLDLTLKLNVALYYLRSAIFSDVE